MAFDWHPASQDQKLHEGQTGYLLDVPLYLQCLEQCWTQTAVESLDIELVHVFLGRHLTCLFNMRSLFLGLLVFNSKLRDLVERSQAVELDTAEFRLSCYILVAWVSMKEIPVANIQFSFSLIFPSHIHFYLKVFPSLCGATFMVLLLNL